MRRPSLANRRNRPELARNGCGTRCGIKSSSNSVRSMSCCRKTTKLESSGLMSSGLDLSELTGRIQAVEGGPGQAPADPRILMTLWLYATLRGVGSARELNRLCQAPRGVSLDLRRRVDELSYPLGLSHPARGTAGPPADRRAWPRLMAEGLVTLDRVAQDGMKVRASAGAASFRRQPTLEEALAEAEQQVAKLRQELEADPAAQQDPRNKRPGQRAAEERARAGSRRLGPVARNCQEQERPRIARKPGPRRPTPTRRVMKMGDGGFRPAFNVQLATATGSQIITGVETTNSGGDLGQLAPMIDQHQQRYEENPNEALVDGGFAKKDDIDQVEQGGTTVYAPVQTSPRFQRDAHTPRADDTPAVAQWRQRMATDEAKAIYRERAATAECVNALARNRGLQRFLVRGLRKVKAVVLWYALAHNLMRAVALRAAAAQAGV